VVCLKLVNSEIYLKGGLRDDNSDMYVVNSQRYDDQFKEDVADNLGRCGSRSNSGPLSDYNHHLPGVLSSYRLPT
jgi:hypothetical protein